MPDFTPPPLIIAAKEGDLEAVRTLLAQNADVNEKDSFDNTAMIWAAFRGHPEIVRLLLENGASPDEKNKADGTALSCARKMGYASIERILEEHALELEKRRKQAEEQKITAEAEIHTKSQIQKLKAKTAPKLRRGGTP